jgi:molybdenum cofactor cytidylyltransferase
VIDSKGPVAAVVLAAGASARMGRPKAFLEFRGETFLGRLVRIFGYFCGEVIVVASGAMEVRGARVVLNPAPERGMLSSLQCGFAAVNPDTAAVAFTPVDHPLVLESTVNRIIQGWRGELLRIPTFDGRRGHPVLMARPLIAEFLALPDGAQARDVIHRHEPDIRYIDTNDPGVVRDIDTPADYEVLR